MRLGIVPDEESEEEVERGGELLVAEGFVGDFAITGEPTDMHVGVAAKGVVAMRLRVDGRGCPRGDPWLGENAILRAVDVFRAIQSLPFASQSSELFDRPSINLGRILGGDALNKVPDTCFIDVDVRHLPEQDPEAILDEVRGIPGVTVVSTFKRPPAQVDPELPFVRALSDATAPYINGETTSVGRDGASDAVSFLRAGVPAVEFGPLGGGHHGPEEWVSVTSLASYRRAVVDFVKDCRAGSTMAAGRRMRPEDEVRDVPPADDGDGAGEPEAPPPATWAGRQRAEGAEAEARPSSTSTNPRTRPKPRARSPTRVSPAGRSPGRTSPGRGTRGRGTRGRGTRGRGPEDEAGERNPPIPDGRGRDPGRSRPRGGRGGGDGRPAGADRLTMSCRSTRPMRRRPPRA